MVERRREERNQIKEKRSVWFVDVSGIRSWPQECQVGKDCKESAHNNKGVNQHLFLNRKKMGNGLASGRGVSDRLLTMLRNEPQIWTEMYNRDPMRTRTIKLTRQQSMIQRLFLNPPMFSLPFFKKKNLSFATFSFFCFGNSHPDSARFEIELLHSIPNGLFVVALIPGSPRSIVRSSDYSTLEEFNGRINELMEKSTCGGSGDNDPSMALLYIDHIFILSPPAGKNGSRVYLQWARQISIYRENDPEIKRTDDLPLFISTDGSFKIWAIYPVIAGDGTGDVNFFNPAKITWIPGLSTRPVNIFSCETRSPPSTSSVNASITPLSDVEVSNRRERQFLPANELLSLTAAASSSSSLDKGRRPWQSDFSVEQEEDGVQEFFAVEQRITEADQLDRNVLADVRYMQHLAERNRDQPSFASAGTTAPGGSGRFASSSFAGSGTTDDETLSNNGTPPSSVRFTNGIRIDSPARRTRVPVGLLPREEHRLGGTGKPRLGIKKAAPASARGSGGSDTSRWGSDSNQASDTDQISETTQDKEKQEM